MQEKRKRELLFPHKNVREVQRDLLDEVKSTIDEKSNLVVHAPTGVGKTAASLPPALKKAIKRNLIVFFLTPRHTQHQIAIDCLKKISENYDKRIVATDLIGKHWMCGIQGIEDISSTAFLDYCKEAREEGRCDFYKNLYTENRELEKEAEELLGKLKRNSPLTTEEVIKVAKRRKICPYYLSLELAKQSKVIIGDYYHVFNPPVRKALLGRVGKGLEDSILIVDEAHLLPGRIRNLLTSKISNYNLRRAKKEAKEFNFKEISQDLDFCLETLKEIAKSKLNGKKEAYVKKGDFTGRIEEKVSKTSSALASDLLLAGKEVRKEKKQSYCGSIGKSIEDWLKERESHVRIIKKDGEYLGLINKSLDPAIITKKIFKESYSSIIMSGSLVPTKMYEDVLGIEGKRREFPSPFPDKNRLVLIYPGVTTKYSERGKEQYDKIAKKCLKMLNGSEVNSAIFFPSYDILEKIKKRLRPKLNGKLFYEENSLNKEEKLKIFKSFKKSENGNLLAVSAGSFSGGMDFPGESLELVIVVGVPLAKPTLEVKSLISYYEKFGGSGWGYGYIYPAVRKVLQAAGRCIRSEDDRGAIVLMDKRYLWKNYSAPLPEYWEPIPTEMPEKVVKRFLT